jgi:hypothetical protein
MICLWIVEPPSNNLRWWENEMRKLAILTLVMSALGLALPVSARQSKTPPRAEHVWKAQRTSESAVERRAALISSSNLIGKRLTKACKMKVENESNQAFEIYFGSARLGSIKPRASKILACPAEAGKYVARSKSSSLTWRLDVPAMRKGALIRWTLKG